MKQRLTLLGAAVAVASCMPFVASANLAVDGNFTTAGTPGSYTTYGAGTTMGGWTVVSGSVDLIGGYWQSPPGGGNSVDMGGNQNGAISQTRNLAAGEYKLTFEMSGNPDGPPALKQLDVSLGGTAQLITYLIGNNSRGTMNYSLETAYFTVATGGDTTLMFQDISSGSGFQNPVGPGGTTPWGAVIGNVSLTAVPEPTTVIAGFGALGLLLFGAGVHSRRSVLRIGK